MRDQQGVGLPELLIALLLSSLISMTLMKHYISVKRQYQSIQTALGQSLELESVAILIRDSVRHAGFTPCIGLEHLIVFDARHPQREALSVSRGRLQVRRMSEHFETVIQAMGPSVLRTTAHATWKSQDSLLVADCYHAEVQTIAKVSRVGQEMLLILDAPLVFSYHEPYYVGPWIEETYAIHTNKHGQSALYYILNHAEALTSAIVDLSFYVERRMGHYFLQLQLHLEKGTLKELDTVVRSQ